ncbi:MAG: sulfotransferase [Anaerolineales bacterium]|nr:sulfotransferase [Anaerolineales bacterium]
MAESIVFTALHGNAFAERMCQTSPTIVLGMHRSGTSLAVRLLNDLGVHMGARLSRDAEAVYFQKLNRRIYQTVGADWANIQSLTQAVQNSRFVDQQATQLAKALFTRNLLLGNKPGIAAFFGPKHWCRLDEDPLLPWGWKDPRTTLLFTIWLKVFPQARIVHLIRNGIDVAISTHRRSLKQQKKLRNHILSFDYKPVTLDFEYCFRLWESYLGYVLERKALIPENQYYELRYEDLLAEPHLQLRSLMSFLGQPVDDSSLAWVSAQINRERLDNSEYARPYADEITVLSQSPLMQLFDYSR